MPGDVTYLLIVDFNSRSCEGATLIPWEHPYPAG